MNFQIVRLNHSNSYLIQSLIDDFLTSKENLSVEHIKNVLQDDRTYLYVAITEQQIVGYCLVYKFPSIYSNHNLAYLYDIEILQEFRKKGIGSRFITTIKEQFIKDNIYELWLGTATDNESGQALFSKTGAIKSGEIFNDYTYNFNTERDKQ